MTKNTMYIQRKDKLYFGRGTNMGFRLPDSSHGYLRPFYLKLFIEVL